MNPGTITSSEEGNEEIPWEFALIKRLCAWHATATEGERSHCSTVITDLVGTAATDKGSLLSLRSPSLVTRRNTWWLCRHPTAAKGGLQA